MDAVPQRAGPAVRHVGMKKINHLQRSMNSKRQKSPLSCLTRPGLSPVPSSPSPPAETIHTQTPARNPHTPAQTPLFLTCDKPPSGWASFEKREQWTISRLAPGHVVGRKRKLLPQQGGWNPSVRHEKKRKKKEKKWFHASFFRKTDTISVRPRRFQRPRFLLLWCETVPAHYIRPPPSRFLLLLPGIHASH